MNQRHVLVLMGGTSSEREISLASGDAVCNALREAGFAVETLDPAHESIDKIRTLRPEAVFIALHGKGGEDGTIQRALDRIGVPYTGPGARASEICMDKVKTKEVLCAAGLCTAPYLVFPADAKDNPDPYFDNAVKTLGFPLVMKAACQGSSIGTVILRDAEGGSKALSDLFDYGDTVFAEKFCSGTELSVPILGTKNPVALPIIEILSDGEFYDYTSKYTPGKSRHIIPARLDEATAKAVSDLAIQAYLATGCAGHARVDMMLTGQGDPCVLEINTSPGMTRTSLFPDAAAKAGINFATLVTKIIECAREKHGLN